MDWLEALQLVLVVTERLLDEVLSSESVVVRGLGLLLVNFGSLLKLSSVGHGRVVKVSVPARWILSCASLVNARATAILFHFISLILLGVLCHLDQVLSVEVHVGKLDLLGVAMVLTLR